MVLQHPKLSKMYNEFCHHVSIVETVIEHILIIIFIVYDEENSFLSG
jgi:hypothetical protein